MPHVQGQYAIPSAHITMNRLSRAVEHHERSTHITMLSVLSTKLLSRAACIIMIIRQCGPIDPRTQPLLSQFIQVKGIVDGLLENAPGLASSGAQPAAPAIRGAAESSEAASCSELSGR